MELRPGYKQTEVGAIPEDWKVASLLKITDFTSGKPHEGNVTREGRYFLITLDSIGIDGVLKSEHKLIDVWDSSLKKNDIVAVLSDIAHGNLLGLCDVIPADDKFVLNQRMGRLRLKVPADSFFVRLQINRRQSHFKKRGQGTSQRHIYKRDFESLEIPFPSEPEQRSIAAALSDVDALLEGLTRLIAKKRDLKQAAMQQLLTGQTRLPGFHGEWEVKRMGAVLTICHGRSQREVETADGPYPILATGGQIGTASRWLYDKPSVLIGRKGTINQPQYMETPFWTVDTLFYSSMNGSNSAKFFYYRFGLIDWMQFNEASGVPSLNARTIEHIGLACPEPAEQAAIATVLSDMDAELAALEARRGKTRALKQAMMQELLTGRTRLV